MLNKHPSPPAIKSGNPKLITLPVVSYADGQGSEIGHHEGHRHPQDGKQDSHHEHTRCGCNDRREHSHEGCERHHGHSHDGCEGHHGHLHNACGGHHEHSHDGCEGHHPDFASPLDHIGCGCSSCEISETDAARPESENPIRLILSKINRISIVGRIAASLVVFATGLVHPAFFLLSYAIAGCRVVLTAFLRINMLDEFFLMTVASAGAIGIGEFPEAAAVMILFEIGEFFKEKAIDKSKNAISDLLSLRPKYVTVRRGGKDIVLMPEEIVIGDLLVVKPGERIALDGTLSSDYAEINNAAITGESAPVHIECGQEILSGGVVIGRPIELTVTKVFRDSTIAKIIALVQNAKESKTPTEQFITKFARIYTPFVVISALAMIVIPTLMGQGDFSEWLHRGLIFLVVSCPCALVISVPLSYFAGIGKSSSLGVLFKGSTYLDAVISADRIVFDKTGTLTTGGFRVTDSDIGKNGDRAVLWKYIYEIESGSTHPLAVAIREFAEAQLAELSVPADRLRAEIREFPGEGMSAKFEDGSTVLLGNAKLMQKEQISVRRADATGRTHAKISEHETSTAKLANNVEHENTGETVIYMSLNGAYIGSIELRDTVREDSVSAVAALRRRMKTTLLSGDEEAVTQRTAAEVGVDEAFGSLLPADKYEIVKKYEKRGEAVIFVGDGINDAPVLAGATVGIAMGLNGSDAAIEAADAVLMKTGIGAIPTVIEVAKFTKKIVIENIALSLAIKAAVLSLSAFGMANMWMAVVSDVGAALIAVLNTLRITKKKFQ